MQKKFWMKRWRRYVFVYFPEITNYGFQPGQGNGMWRISFWRFRLWRDSQGHW